MYYNKGITLVDNKSLTLNAYCTIKTAFLLILILCAPVISSANSRPDSLRLAYFLPKGDPSTEWYSLVFHEALSRVDIKFELVFLPLKRASVYVNAGKYDGEVTRVYSYSDKYQNLVRVEEHLSKLVFVAYSRDPNLKVTNWEDFKDLDLKVGYIHGSKKATTQLTNGNLY